MLSLVSNTSLGGTFNIFDAARKISGAGFKFSKASAETIASNLIKQTQLQNYNKLDRQQVTVEVNSMKPGIKNNRKYMLYALHLNYSYNNLVLNMQQTYSSSWIILF